MVRGAPYVADADTADWLGELTAHGGRREAAIERLHAVLLRVARAETRRRSGQLRISGPELDDLAHQAAADAVLAVMRKLGDFRGESRFTTWAYTFVMFEVSATFARHFWRHPTVPLDAGSVDDTPDRLGVDPEASARAGELAAALRHAVQHELTDRQRQVFVPVALGGVPLEVLALELGSSRGSLYKVLFDARRRLRATLVARGLVSQEVRQR
jgi:RNA polymerase sigma-70 factor (ECF subfamily)